MLHRDPNWIKPKEFFSNWCEADFVKSIRSISRWPWDALVAHVCLGAKSRAPRQVPLICCYEIWLHTFSAPILEFELLWNFAGPASQGYMAGTDFVWDTCWKKSQGVALAEIRLSSLPIAWARAAIAACARRPESEATYPESERSPEPPGFKGAPGFRSNQKTKKAAAILKHSPNLGRIAFCSPRKYRRFGWALVSIGEFGAPNGSSPNSQ